MITWKEKITFYGLKIIKLNRHQYGFNSLYKYNIKLSYNPGRCSFGSGDTIEEALEDAVISLPISWASCKEKITKMYWEKISCL